MKPIKESVLLKTSAATDVQCSGGNISITGLKPVNKNYISSILQVKYKAEVAQVVTIGATSYTPQDNTTYSVMVWDPTRVYAGFQESKKVYSYTTGTVTGVAATDRETIHAALVTKINADASNHAVAASLGSGNGFTVTDDGSYYPVWAQNMTNVKGVNLVRPVTNKDGSGFAASNYTLTTAGVYSFGVGANLLAEKPVINYTFGNLVSGVLIAPPLATDGTGAVSGQNYDGFVINSLQTAEAVGITGQYAFVERTQVVFVDNGTGSSTTNLSGFKAIERVFHKLMVQVYRNDASCIQEWFDSPIVFQDPLGAAPTGTANTLGWTLSRYTALNKTNIGTATVVSPVLNADGLVLDQDNTDTEGAHYSANQQTLGDQSFVVGKTAFMVGARLLAGDWTDACVLVGFRKKAAYTADFNDYTDLAAIGGGTADGDSVYTYGILNNAATVATDTTVNFADSVSSMVWIKVALDGTVSAFYNGTSYPIYSAGTTTLILDANDEMIPFFQFKNIGGGDPDLVIAEFFAVASTDLIG